MAKTKADSASTASKAAASSKSTSASSKSTSKAPASSGKAPKTSLNSAVTTDLPDTPAGGDGMTTLDLSKAEIKVPTASLSTPSAVNTEWTDADETSMTSRDRGFETRVLDYGIGQVQVEGIDFRYVGVAPARDKDAQTESEYPITPMNSRFTPLGPDVAFHPSIRCKDAKTGKFYFPDDTAANWSDVVSPDGNPLIPKEAHKASAAARREALKAARSR